MAFNLLCRGRRTAELAEGEIREIRRCMAARSADVADRDLVYRQSSRLLTDAEVTVSASGRCSVIVCTKRSKTYGKSSTGMPAPASDVSRSFARRHRPRHVHGSPRDISQIDRRQRQGHAVRVRSCSPARVRRDRSTVHARPRVPPCAAALRGNTRPSGRHDAVGPRYQPWVVNCLVPAARPSPVRANRPNSAVCGGEDMWHARCSKE